MEMLVHDMRETGTPPTVSEKFSACYDRLKEGETTLPVADVVAILPELFTHLEYLESISNLRAKAPRPDALSATASNASSRRNMRSVRQSFANSTAALVK